MGALILAIPYILYRGSVERRLRPLLVGWYVTTLLGLGGTTPVGRHPSGVSPFGCQDMAGNVREWLADVDNSSAETRDRRQAAGGSWDDIVSVIEEELAGKGIDVTVYDLA